MMQLGLGRAFLPENPSKFSFFDSFFRFFLISLPVEETYSGLQIKYCFFYGYIGFLCVETVVTDI